MTMAWSGSEPNAALISGLRVKRGDLTVRRRPDVKNTARHQLNRKNAIIIAGSAVLAGYGSKK